MAVYPKCIITSDSEVVFNVPCLCFCRRASGPGSRRTTEVQEEDRRGEQPVSAPTERLAPEKNMYACKRPSEL